MNKAANKKQIEQTTKVFAENLMNIDRASFDEKLNAIFAYLGQNRNNNNKDIVNALITRIEAIRDVSDDIGILYWGDRDSGNKNYVSTEQPDEDDEIFDREEENREQIISDRVIDNFNLAIGSGNNTLREDVSKFLDSIDYETVGSDGYNQLMDIVNRSENLDYSLNTYELNDISSEINNSAEVVDPIDGLNSEIKDIADFCKENNLVNFDQVQNFIQYHEESFVDREKLSHDKVFLGPEKEIIENEINTLTAERDEIHNILLEDRKGLADIQDLRNVQLIMEINEDKLDKLNQVATEGPKIVKSWLKLNSLKSEMQDLQKDGNNPERLNACKAEFDALNTKDKSGKNLADYTLQEIDVVKETADNAEMQYTEKMNEYNKMLGYPATNEKLNHHDLNTKIETDINQRQKVLKSKLPGSEYVKLDRKEMHLNEDIKKLSNISDDDLLKIKQEELAKEKKNYEKIKPAFDKIMNKKSELNSSIDKANESIKDNAEKSSVIENPKDKASDAAFKNIASHLDDKKGFFHRDSKEFKDMKADLEVLNNTQDPAKRKELMEKLQKSSSDYLKAKTKDGTDKNRLTANGRARQSYAEQINKLCTETLQADKEWEVRTSQIADAKVNNISDTMFKDSLNAELKKQGVEINNDASAQISKIRSKSIINEVNKEVSAVSAVK